MTMLARQRDAQKCQPGDSERLCVCESMLMRHEALRDFGVPGVLGQTVSCVTAR